MPAPTRRLQPPLPNAWRVSYPRCVDAIPKRPPQIGFDVPDEKQLVARLLAVARRLLRNEEDARDCVQDAFLQAFRNIEQFEERASLGGWLPHNDVSHGFV